MVEVRSARDAEARACLTLLPEAFAAQGWGPDLYVAAGPEGVVGAAAMAWVPRGFPVLVHVREPWRRRGVGRALLAAAAEAARGETHALRAWTTVEEDGAAARFLASAGFALNKRLLAFETDGAAFEAAMGGLLARVGRRIPEDARLVSLGEAPGEEVALLVAAQFGTLPHDVARRLAPGRVGGYDKGLSLVLLQDGAVKGAMLCRRVGEVIEVEVNVVAPAFRHGVANLMLLEAMARRGRLAGAERFRFACEAGVTDTLNLARRSFARPLPAQVHMVRRLV